MKVLAVGDNTQRFSRYLSYILRHHPEDLGLVLDNDGFVSTDSKNRYSFRDNNTYIRANYGHSVCF